MANDNEISVKIVADLEDIKKQLGELNKSSEKTAQGIGDSFGSVGGKLALFATGLNQGIQLVEKIAEAIKKLTVEVVILGERAAQVENGFRSLADSAGISSSELLNGIVRANDGIIDQTDLLSRASQLIVRFGKSAERLPEILELSRKIAVSFGIDTEEAFQKATQAIIRGDARGLKQLGLTIDTEQAIKAYASANGVAANAINEVGRAQAILNAALDVGKQSFSSIELGANNSAEALSRIGSALNNMIEAIGIIISDTGFPDWLNRVAGGINIITERLVATFGSGIDQVKAKIPTLRNEIIGLENDIHDLETNGLGIWDRLFNPNIIAEKKKELSALRQELASLGTGEVMGPAAPAALGGPSPQDDIVNKQQLAKNEAAFRAQINQIRLQSAQEAMQLAVDEESLEIARTQRQAALEEQLAIKKQEVRNNDLLSIQQQNILIEELVNQHESNKLMIERQYENERLMMLQTRMEMARSFDEQVAASAEMQSARTSQAWRRSGQLGGAAISAFSNRTMAAFAAVGAGTMTMAEAMRSAFFGMLGDVASAQGKTMFLTNLAPPLGPNPAGMAAGLGLIALGGLLSSMGGGAKMGGGVGGGGAGGGPEFGGGFGGPGISDAQERRKEVTINIEGNYFESEQTKLAIVEAVRSSSDAQDFTIQRGNRR